MTETFIVIYCLQHDDTKNILSWPNFLFLLIRKMTILLSFNAQMAQRDLGGCPRI